MLLSAFIKQGIQTLEKIYPSQEARGMVLLLCEEVLGVKNYTHIIEPGYEIPAESLAVLLKYLERLASNEPLQYVLSYAEFCGHRFAVSPSVLIPRPETELLVAQALEEMQKRGPECRVLDLCTGSGCIAWSLALERKSAEIVAVDISEAALELASSQFDRPGPLFVKADVLDVEQDFRYGLFDLIVSNPPYIMEAEKLAMRKNVLDFEPELALFVPDEDPLIFYRALARWAERFLKDGGCAIVEINESLGRETAELFVSAGFQKLEIIKDLYSKSRFVKFWR